jgi:hypothetical protein
MIIFQKGVLNYLDDLVYILFKQEYFGFMQSSYDYVDKIIDFIENDIATFPTKKTPVALKNFGSKYIFYKSNQRTTWYIFFENKNNNYLITNIINSHCEEIKWL